MLENKSHTKKDIFQFARESELLLNQLSIETPSNLWANFFTRVNNNSDDMVLIKNLSEVFSVEITEVDLKKVLPEGLPYLVKTDNQWFFLKNVNHLEKNTAIAYVVCEKNVIEESSHISFIDLLHIDKNHFLTKILFLSFFINAFALTIPLYFNAIYGRIIPASAESSLWTLSFIALLCFICELSLKNSKVQYSSLLMKEFNDKLQPMLYNYCVIARNHIDNHWGGDKVRLQKEIKDLNALLWGMVSTNFLDVIFIFIFFFVIYVMSGVLVAVPIIVFFIQLIIGVFFSKSERKIVTHRYNYSSLAELDSGYISGLSRMLCASNYLRDASEYFKSNFRFLIKQFQMNIMYFFISLQNILITITAFYLIQEHDLSIASLFAVVILSSRISQSTSGFVASIPLLYQIKEKIKFINGYRDNLIQSSSNRQLVTSFSILLNELSFGYETNHYIFENINIKIHAGEKIAFVGNPGCGKTSLLKLIGGLCIPLSGQVTLLDDSGKTTSIDAIRNRIHYIPQEPLLYGESLISHLCSEKEHSDEQCKSALKMPLMNWLLPLLKNGLYTKFDELPYELSSTKKQFLAFSRFTLTERDIWFFDSPTHFFDSKSQRFFIDVAKQKMTKDTTLLLFTDNADLFELVDRVVAFNNCGIIFDGTKNDFLTQYT